MGEVCAHLAQLERSFPLLGLQLNSSPRGASPNAVLAEVRRTMPGIVEIVRNSSILLGSPLGDEALDTSSAGCIDKIELICGMVKFFDSHWALFFLTKHTSAPRFSHILRSSPAYLQPTVLHTIDSLVHEALTGCTIVQLVDDVWTQATLALRFGGLGASSIVDLVLPCYLSLMHSMLDLTGEIFPMAADFLPALTASTTALKAKFPDKDLPTGDLAKKQQM